MTGTGPTSTSPTGAGPSSTAPTGAAPTGAGGPSLYDAVGGSPVFHQLVEHFYAGVENDPVLRPLYPDDLGPARERLRLFLEQYWGGPRTYSETRGHPRLRMRHAQWRIGAREREAWLSHMLAAVDALPIAAAQREALRGYVGSASFSLINDDGQ